MIWTQPSGPLCLRQCFMNIIVKLIIEQYLHYFVSWTGHHDRDRYALFFSRTTKREGILHEVKKEIAKERKHLTWHRKWDWKGKQGKYLSEGKKHSDMKISNRFDNRIFAIRKWLPFLRFYQGPPGRGSLALPRGEVRARSLFQTMKRSASRWEADSVQFSAVVDNHNEM